VQVHVVSDGQVVVPLSEGFVQNASIDAVREALAEAGLPTDTLTTTFAPLVLETAGRKVVIDAGLGPDAAAQPGSTRGLLTRNMRAGGIDPDDISTVVISHFHPDHVNGLVSNGAPVFRNAEVAVPGVEWRFWRDDGEMARATPGRMAELFANNRRIFELVRDRIRIYEWEEEVVPGLEAAGTPGHSIGHTSYWLGSESERIFVQSDLTNHAALFVRHPDWSAAFDQDPAAAVAVRRETYEMLARERVPLQAYHHPFPGRAIIEKDGDGYRRVVIS
jgi:glyoxylase-like metal-dependent hydrolase (beta-lactamase superfamily II)